MPTNKRSAGKGHRDRKGVNYAKRRANHDAIDWGKKQAKGRENTEK